MKELLQLLICLYAGHIVGDFLLQWDYMAKRKKESIIWMGFHSMIVAAITVVLCGLWSAGIVVNLVLFISIFLVHAFQDQIKLEFENGEKTSRFKQVIFYFDQILHFSVAFVIAWILVQLSVVEIFWMQLLDNIYLEAIVFISGLVIASMAGGYMTGSFVEPYLQELRDESEYSQGLVNGGKIIGILERLLIFIFVLSNELSAIGFLIAAKSLLRYGSMQGKMLKKETEYILIGTMFSFTVAILASFMTLKLIEYVRAI